jgi:predicted kinase
MSKMELIVMCGLPGSGKSTYAKYNYENPYVVVCADEYRKVLTGTDFYAPAENIVSQMVGVTVEVMLKRLGRVVLDMTCLRIKTRKRWIEMADRCDVPVSCTWMDATLEHCLKTNRNRDRQVPEDIIIGMHDRFEPPTEDEGFYAIDRIDVKGM